jgi:hypothetical protein
MSTYGAAGSWSEQDLSTHSVKSFAATRNSSCHVFGLEDLGVVTVKRLPHQPGGWSMRCIVAFQECQVKRGFNGGRGDG